MIGMIPDGRMLLTGVTLTVGALKLARRRALVQSLYSIETLARSDVLCLDKTGTITDGTLSFERLVPFEGTTATDMGRALDAMMTALSDENATAQALRAAFALRAADASPDGARPRWAAEGTWPFSAAGKWRAAALAQQGC